MGISMGEGNIRTRLREGDKENQADTYEDDQGPPNRRGVPFPDPSQLGGNPLVQICEPNGKTQNEPADKDFEDRGQGYFLPILESGRANPECRNRPADPGGH